MSSLGGSIEASPFGAGRAFRALLVYLGTQVVILLFGSIFLWELQKKGSRSIAIVPLGVLLVGYGSLATMVWIIRKWALGLVRDRSLTGLGLVRPSISSFLTWLLLGATIGAVYLVLTRSPGLRSAAGEVGRPIWMQIRGAFSVAVWVLVSLFVVPITDELMFRGLLLGGFTASWGIGRASLFSTVIFVGVYLIQSFFDWRLTIAAAMMAIAALAARLRSGSIYCSMAVRFAFELVMGARLFLEL